MTDAIKASQSKFDNDTVSRGDIVYKILGIDEVKGERSPNIVINHKHRKLIGDDRIVESASDSNLQDFDKLRHLLQNEDARYHQSSLSAVNRPKLAIRKIKDASKELINKRMNALRNLRSNSSSQDSTDAPPSDASLDFTVYNLKSSTRFSTSDLGATIKRVKRTKSKYSSAPTEGGGMTTLLVRSLMAGPSLDCIAESNDLELGARRKSLTPANRTDSLASLPTLATTPTAVSEPPLAAHTQRKRNKLQLTLGDSLIDLKASDSNVSSNAVTSCEESSLSEEEEDDSDGRSLRSNDNEVVLIDADTISMVVKSALAKDEEQTGETLWIHPSDHGDSDSDDSNKKEVIRRHLLISAIRTGATRIITPRNSKKKRDMETRLVENDAQPEFLEDILANPQDEDERNWIQPGSTGPEDGDDNEPRPGSLYHNFKESISDAIHQIHMPHHHPKAEVKDHSLVGTAMGTMLLEQAELMGAHAANVNVDQVRLAEKRNSSFDSLRKLITSPFRRRSNDSLSNAPSGPGISVSSPTTPVQKPKFGLVDTAMKTMVVETAHIIEGVGVHPIDSVLPRSIENVAGDLETDRDRPLICLLPQYNNFRDNLCGSQILDTDSSVTKSKTPVLTLTIDPENAPTNQSLHSLNTLPPNRELDTHTRSFTRSLQSIPSELHKPRPHSSHRNRLTDNPIGTSINQTNKTKLLAPRSCPTHRSGDTLTNSNQAAPALAANGNATHARTESVSERVSSNPTKVPNSSSYGSTALATANATTAISGSKEKEKDKENNICRRSSDSDLSVTPKGKRSLAFRFAH